MNRDKENKACKTCSTKMDVIDRGCEWEEYKWWCPQCGTLAVESAGYGSLIEWFTPAKIGRPPQRKA